MVWDRGGWTIIEPFGKPPARARSSCEGWVDALEIPQCCSTMHSLVMIKKLNNVNYRDSGLAILIAWGFALGKIEPADQVDLALMKLVLECTRHCQP